MQASDGVFPVNRGKTLLKAAFELGCQVDFWNHYQGLRQRVTFQKRLDALQVHLGFSAPGGAEKHKGPGLAFYVTQNLGLFWAENRSIAC